VENPEGRRPLGRHIRRWQDNIKMDLKAIRRDVVGWIDLAQDRDQWRTFLNMVMDFLVSRILENS
jgi:hypothetical protein